MTKMLSQSKVTTMKRTLILMAVLAGCAPPEEANYERGTAVVCHSDLLVPSEPGTIVELPVELDPGRL